MSTRQQDDRKLVRQFRQILLWPLQLVPIREGAQIQEHWELLERKGPDNPWGQVRDEFSGGPGGFQQRHYSEFVTFLPYGRRFLYGDAKGGGQSTSESPIRVFRRTDIASVRITHPGGTEPCTLDVSHVDLCFFYDLDVVILVVEVSARDLCLAQAQDTMYRFGRAYPTYWDESGLGGHCPVRVERLPAQAKLGMLLDVWNRKRTIS